MKLAYAITLVGMAATSMATPAPIDGRTAAGREAMKECGTSFASRLHDSSHCVFFFIPQGSGHPEDSQQFHKCCFGRWKNKGPAGGASAPGDDEGDAEGAGQDMNGLGDNGEGGGGDEDA